MASHNVLVSMSCKMLICRGPEVQIYFLLEDMISCNIMKCHSRVIACILMTISQSLPLKRVLVSSSLVSGISIKKINWYLLIQNKI